MEEALFNVLYIFNVFYFQVPRILILLNLLISYIKRLLSDRFNMAAIGNSLMKSHSSQTLSCTLYDPKTVILLEIFSSGLNNFVHLSTTSFIECFFMLGQ